MKVVRKVVLLQYGKAGEQRPHSNPVDQCDSQKFVALDSASGGYPYSVEIENAHNFKTVESAQRYNGEFHIFHVREVNVTYEF